MLYNAATTRAFANEMISFRNQMVDWQLQQLKVAQENGLAWMKASVAAMESGEKALRATNAALLDTFAPTESAKA